MSDLPLFLYYKKLYSLYFVVGLENPFPWLYGPHQLMLESKYKDKKKIISVFSQ